MAHASSDSVWHESRNPKSPSRRKIAPRPQSTNAGAPRSGPAKESIAGGFPMDKPTKKLLRCAIYTRKSTDHNLDLEFNSLDAQREACEAYIKSQAHEGWRLIPDHY